MVWANEVDATGVGTAAADDTAGGAAEATGLSSDLAGDNDTVFPAVAVVRSNLFISKFLYNEG